METPLYGNIYWYNIYNSSFQLLYCSCTVHINCIQVGISVCVGELTLYRNLSSTQLHWPQTLCLQGSPLLFPCNKYRSWPRAPWQQAWGMTYLLYNGGIYHTTTMINEKKAHSQTVEEPGVRDYFLLLTISGFCLLLCPDKLLHDLPRYRQAGSSEDIYSYWLLEKKTHTLDSSPKSHCTLAFSIFVVSPLSSFIFPQVCCFFPVTYCCSPQLSLALWIPSLKQWDVAGTLWLTMMLKASCLPIASIHFMVHILCSPFVRVPLAPTLISLTPSHTNNNKSNAHLFFLAATALFPLSDFQLKCTERTTKCMGLCSFRICCSLVFWSLITMYL